MHQRLVTAAIEETSGDSGSKLQHLNELVCCHPSFRRSSEAIVWDLPDAADKLALPSNTSSHTHMHKERKIAIIAKTRMYRQTFVEHACSR